MTRTNELVRFDPDDPTTWPIYDEDSETGENNDTDDSPMSDTDTETVEGTVVAETEIGWGDDLGDVEFEVWEAGTYKLVKTDD